MTESPAGQGSRDDCSWNSLLLRPSRQFQPGAATEAAPTWTESVKLAYRKICDVLLSQTKCDDIEAVQEVFLTVFSALPHFAEEEHEIANVVIAEIDEIAADGQEDPWSNQTVRVLHEAPDDPEWLAQTRAMATRDGEPECGSFRDFDRTFSRIQWGRLLKDYCRGERPQMEGLKSCR